MGTLAIASRANQATTFPALLIAHFIGELDPKNTVEVRYEDTEKLRSGEGNTVEFSSKEGQKSSGAEQAVAGIIQASSALEKFPSQTAVKEWLHRTNKFHSVDFKSVEGPLLELDAHLTLRSYIVGYTLTYADLSVWGAIKGNKVASAAMKKGSVVNVSRWHKFIEETNPWITTTIQAANTQAQAKKLAKSQEANYDIGLLDTEKGVVTRFPPEPSGYLHIGHAKAALLNDYFAHEKYDGTLLCRFDDTNPSKEKEEFQDAIVEDLALMGIHPDKTTYTSNYFDELYQFCIKLIEDGKAFADNTEQKTMAEERAARQPSKCRDASVEDNLKHFREMKEGTPEGTKWCIRAKIKYDSPNGALRDPVIYRCNPEPHHRTGSKWKIYPTYDFACPIVDSMEGITHALRTIEYRDRNPQYEWMLNALALRKVHIWDFARMNFIRTLLSKRKLTKLVEKGMVTGWDDPRFPTIRGIRRRGMTIPALREFILRQGPSKNIVNLDWTIFWATNKKYIDPVAPRHTAIIKDRAIKAKVKGARLAPQVEEKPKHAKNPDVGLKKVVYSDEILIEQEDARNFSQDEEITLMNWGNAYVRSISHSLNPLTRSTVTELELELHLQGDVKTTKQKITWLSTKGQELIPVELVDYDFLITKDVIEEGDNLDDFLNPNSEDRIEALADCNVANLHEDDIIQFERKGYYRVDKAFQHGQSAVFINIPTGKAGKGT